LDQWISKEVIPAQKFHYQTFHSDKQLGWEVQKLSAFLSNKDNKSMSHWSQSRRQKYRLFIQCW
jgi:hypothetical protein